LKHPNLAVAVATFLAEHLMKPGRGREMNEGTLAKSRQGFYHLALMTEHAILTAIGADRPGLVDEVSAYILEHGGNIEDSRMVNLRGQFAMMVLIAGDHAVMDRIQADLDALASRAGLQTDFRPAGRDSSKTAGAAMPYRLTATALDQSGLVHRVAHLLREMNINIESMDTRLAAAPYTGAPVFEMEVVMSIPRGVAVQVLRKNLGELCDELNIDWNLTAG
jgi:glycine cleavage system transcriptional repressor